MIYAFDERVIQQQNFYFQKFMPKFPTSEKQNRPKLNPEQLKLSANTILLGARAGSGVKSDDHHLLCRYDESTPTPTSFPIHQKNPANHNPSTATPKLRATSRKNSIQIQGREQQSKSILNVINKYVTMEQLKKHQEKLEKQLKKVEQLDKSDHIRTDNRDNHQWVRAVECQYKPSDDCSYKIDLLLERIELDPMSKEIFQNSNIINQISKINDQVSKLQYILNSPSEKSPILSPITHNINRLLLSLNFLFSKLSMHHQQSYSSLQICQDLCNQLRGELHTLHISHSQVTKMYQQSANSEKELLIQINKIRSVMQCYQKENFEFRKQIKLLEEVIEEMNVQVDKGEKKLQEKRKQFRKLEEDVKRMGIYVQQLEKQIKSEVGLQEQVRRLRQIHDHQNQQIIKWKSRCFKEFKEQKQQSHTQIKTCD